MIGVPAVPVKVVLAMLNVAWAAFAKVKLLAADVASRLGVLAAFIAVTRQVVASVAVRDVPETEHPVPVTE